MRPDLRSLRSTEDLGRLLIHELVRDYPELLPMLEDMGLSPGKHGTDSLAQVVGRDEGALEKIQNALHWRG